MGIKEWGGDKYAHAFHFFSSPVKKGDEGVMMDLEKNRPVRKLLQSSRLSPVDTAEEGRNRCSHGRWQKLKQSKKFISPRGKECDLK